MDDADLDLADGDHVAVLNRVVVVGWLGERVDRDACAVLEREAAVSRDVVGVVVRLDDANDLHAVPLRLGDVLLDRVRGIDDDRLARGFGADEVRRAAEVGIDELAEEHGGTPLLLPGISGSYT